jgi:hypothetical protein
MLHRLGILSAGPIQAIVVVLRHRLCLALAAIGLLAGAVEGAAPDELPLALDPPKPHFGRITTGWGTDPPMPVRLANRAGRPVRVTRIVAGCGCLVADIDLPVTIEPGHDAELRLTLRLPRMKVGTQTYEISAWDGSTLLAKSSASYEYDPPLVADPPELILNVDSAGADAQQAVRLRIRHPMTQPLRAECDAADVALSVRPGDGPDIAYVVATARPTTRPAGRSRHQVSVFGSGESGPALVMPLLYRVVSPVELRPPTLLLGPVAPGQAITRQVKVILREGFAIHEARCSSPAFRASWASAGGVTTLDVVVTPLGDSIIDGTITLVLDGPQVAELALRVIGEGTPTTKPTAQVR